MIASLWIAPPRMGLLDIIITVWQTGPHEHRRLGAPDRKPRERAYPGPEAALFSEAHRAFNRMMAATP